jgi:signal transduction histidine kinase
MPPFTPESLVSGELLAALKRRLVAAAVGLCLLILGVVWAVLVASFDQGIKGKQEDIGRAAHLMGRHTSQLIEYLDALLLETMDDLAAENLGDTYKLHLELKSHAQHIKAINEIVFIGPEGLARANSFRYPPSGVNVGHRSYFQFHQANPNGGLFISEPLQRPQTDVWNITLSRRVPGPNGSFGGVLLIAVSPEYFAGLYNSLGFRHEYAVTLFRKDATLLARFPSAPELLGKVFGKNPEARAFFDGDAEAFSTRFARPNVDQRPNLVEFRRVPNYPMVITSSVPEQVVYDAWRDMALGVGFIAGISILVVVVVFFVLFQEINRRAEAQRKAAEDILRSNADLEQFAYAVSHDLKAPLRTVGGFLELLNRKHGAELSEEAHEFLSLAKGGAKRMQTRLFQNLIGNALKYRHPGVAPEIKLSTRRAGGDWEIVVSDNGIGIDPSQTNKLFKVFSRLHSVESYEGTGIGLALCRSIVERHGGRIWVNSEGEGKGSAFTFTLPAVR